MLKDAKKSFSFFNMGSYQASTNKFREICEALILNQIKWLKFESKSKFFWNSHIKIF